jgi:DNA excision repair protein ERCC-2
VAETDGTDGYLRFFPYAEPYPNQREAMERIADALARHRDVLLEGAPGTGKTLSALAPALEHARREDKTVVITTNVHQQTRQFIQDARAITDREPIRAAVFRGKGSMCHIDVDYQECQTLRDTARELVDVESDQRELSQRADDLLEAMQEGDDEAAAARQAVTDELDTVRQQLEDLEEANYCERFYENLTRDTDAFREWLFADVRTPEDVYDYADQRGLCGYELLKESMEEVDLAICNYNHLLDPTIREQFFRWLDRDPSEVVVVFDEAHNVESAAREHATRTLTENTLSEALSELEEADDSRADAAENVLGAFRSALREVYEGRLSGPTGPRAEGVDEDWIEIGVANDDRRDDLTLSFLEAYEGRGIDTEIELAIQLGSALEDEYERAYREGETTTRQESQTLQAAGFVEAWLSEGTALGHHPMVAVRRDAGTDEIYGRAELYTAIPREVTAELFGEVHASVLMSATLRPFDVLEDVLGLEDPETLAYELAYPEENRRTFAVAGPALFASERGDADTQQIVADALADAVRATPGNTLAFFPSYAEAERYHERLRHREGVPATLYRDEPGTPSQKLRERFVDDDHGALFTSLWGTLAEGVSFDGDDARTVIVVGVPYPHLSERLEAVQDAYDRAYERRDDAGWRYAVEIPTIRKTRQALGRVIRGPDDFGVRVLLDERYTKVHLGKYSVRESFPPEERTELIDVEPEKLQFAMLNFFADQDAYDGDPPAP